MDKNKFVEDLKKSALHHYESIDEDSALISLGFYSDGDASTIGIYYNTEEHLNKKLKELEGEEGIMSSERGYYTFFMEEWKRDISYPIGEEQLDKLNDLVYEFGTSEYESGNEDYKDEVFNMFVQALLDLKLSGTFKNESEDFFLHLEVSDHWIDEKMLERISLLHSKKRFEEYKIYVYGRR